MTWWALVQHVQQLRWLRKYVWSKLRLWSGIALHPAKSPLNYKDSGSTKIMKNPFASTVFLEFVYAKWPMPLLECQNQWSLELRVVELVEQLWLGCSSDPPSIVMGSWPPHVRIPWNVSQANYLHSSNKSIWPQALTYVVRFICCSHKVESVQSIQKHHQHCQCVAKHLLSPGFPFVGPE